VTSTFATGLEGVDLLFCAGAGGDTAHKLRGLLFAVRPCHSLSTDALSTANRRPIHCEPTPYPCQPTPYPCQPTSHRGASLPFRVQGAGCRVQGAG